MPATRKVKVRCSDRDGCGWSGERAPSTATVLRYPLCRLYSVEEAGRVQPESPTPDLVAYYRAQMAKEA